MPGTANGIVPRRRFELFRGDPMQSTVEELPPFAPGIFAVADSGDVHLLGGWCPRCRRHFFPQRRYCPGCLEAPEPARVGSRGSVCSFTVVRTKPPLGLPRPYSVGYVDLKESGLRVFMLLDGARIERLRIGLRVRLRAGPLGCDDQGRKVVRPYFTPWEE